MDPNHTGTPHQQMRHTIQATSTVPFGTSGQYPSFGSHPFGTTPSSSGSATSTDGILVQQTQHTSGSNSNASATSLPHFMDLDEDEDADTQMFQLSPFHSSAWGSSAGYSQHIPTSTAQYQGSSLPAFSDSTSTPFGSSAYGAQATSAFGSSAIGGLRFSIQQGNTNVTLSIAQPEASQSLFRPATSVIQPMSVIPGQRNISPEELRWLNCQSRNEGGQSTTSSSASSAIGELSFGIPTPRAFCRPVTSVPFHLSFGQPLNATPSPFRTWNFSSELPFEQQRQQTAFGPTDQQTRSEDFMDEREDEAVSSRLSIQPWYNRVTGSSPTSQHGEAFYRPANPVLQIQSISAAPLFENTSHEELRWIHYDQLNKAGLNPHSQLPASFPRPFDKPQDPALWLPPSKKAEAPPKILPKDPKFCCPICMEVIKEIYSTICGHVFCQPCIKTAINVQKKCPTCRKQLKPSNFHRVFLP